MINKISGGHDLNWRYVRRPSHHVKFIVWTSYERSILDALAAVNRTALVRRPQCKRILNWRYSKTCFVTKILTVKDFPLLKKHGNSFKHEIVMFCSVFVIHLFHGSRYINFLELYFFKCLRGIHGAIFFLVFSSYFVVLRTFRKNYMSKCKPRNHLTKPIKADFALQFWFYFLGS